MPRSTKAEKESKRRKVATGVVAGKSTRAIAKKAGCTERHAQRLAKEAETQFLITEAMRPHRAALEKLAKKVLAAVGGALVAKKTDKADHFSRLRAVARFKQLMEMAQGKPTEEGETGAGLVTWEEFTLLYRTRREISGDHSTVAPPVE